MCRIFEKGVAKPWPVPPFRREEEAAACFPQNGSSFSRQSSHLPQDLRGPRNLMTMRRQTRFVMRPTLAEKEIEWKGWYSLRRFLGTAVRMTIIHRSRFCFVAHVVPAIIALTPNIPLP